jgi:LHFPL tetraspan subfamily member protein
MGSKVEYVDSSQMYATSYARNSKAVAVLWGVFTLCYAVICVVAFVTPEWLGSTTSGRVGVWTICNSIDAHLGVETCIGKLDDVTTIPGPALRAAAILVGLGTLMALVCVVALLLFFFCGTTNVFMICGWIQLLSGNKKSFVTYKNALYSYKMKFCRPENYLKKYYLTFCDL